MIRKIEGIEAIDRRGIKISTFQRRSSEKFEGHANYIGPSKGINCDRGSIYILPSPPLRKSGEKTAQTIVRAASSSLVKRLSSTQQIRVGVETRIKLNTVIDWSSKTLETIESSFVNNSPLLPSFHERIKSLSSDFFILLRQIRV